MKQREADPQARQEMVALQREVQAERNDVGRQRDLLEGERRELAAKARIDPIILGFQQPLNRPCV